MIARLVLLGATGDLAGRFLLPALAALHAAGQLPDGFQVVGAAQPDWAEETFRAAAAARLEEHAASVPLAAREDLLRGLRYRSLDVTRADGLATVLGAFGGEGAREPIAVYLALPPATFPAVIRAWGAADLPPGSRIAVEKPFGEDLDSAVSLNALLTRANGGADEAVFRVDHVLGMPRVQTLLELRAPDGPLGPVWNGTSIRQVDLLWEETLGPAGRAEFYDRTGAVRDVVQNHLLQVLALVALELPSHPAGADLHQAKVDLLRSVHRLAPAEVAARTRRARYTAGVLHRTGGGAGSAVPDYVLEPGVDPARDTETYAELMLRIDVPRWTGTRFVLRAGKALDRDRKGVGLHFRNVAPAGLPGGTEPVSADQMWIELNGPQPGGRADVPGELSAYREVLTDLLTGSSRTSVSQEESEQAWAIVDPVRRAWAAGATPLLEYPAGSAGPGLLA